MTTNDKNVEQIEIMDTQISETIEETPVATNVVSIVNINEIKKRFDTLVNIMTHKQSVFNHLPIILEDVKALSETEIHQIMVYIHATFKSMKEKITPSKIEGHIRDYLSRDKDWQGRNFIGEDGYQMYFLGGRTSSDKIYISNFILDPMYTIKVEGPGGQKFHVYSVKINGDHRTYVIMLTSDHFNELKGLQAEISRQLVGTSANINNCSGRMGDIFHKYVTLANFKDEKKGTSLIGLERLENNGPKYFCTPNAIFDMNGNVSEEILYMGNDQTNAEELKNLTNLEYEKDSWKEIASTFLQNIIRINDKVAMMCLIGWMGAIPHDYVIRKEVPTGYFPHCHIIGEPGSGKSTIMTLLKQFMGHNDSAPRSFPTAFEVSKLLNSSYTIPIVLDEYGKRWDHDRTEKINTILVESFTRSRWSRGQSNLGSVYYKYKNPILMGGQIPTSDQALVTRIVDIKLFKSFHTSKLGKQSKKHLTELQKMADKNFWVGYNLWCAQFSNDQVEEKFRQMRDLCSPHILDSRVADIYASVLLGLTYMKQLSEELNVDIGFTNEDIANLASMISKTSDAANIAEQNVLEEFLHDVATYGISIGNSTHHGNYFGKNLSVSAYRSPNSGAGVYGTNQPACVYGKELILVKIGAMVTRINTQYRKNYTEKEVMTFIESEFRRSMENPESPDNFVLAPKSYKTVAGMHTAFSRDVLFSKYPEFTNIDWAFKIKK